MCTRGCVESIRTKINVVYSAKVLWKMTHFYFHWFFFSPLEKILSVLIFRLCSCFWKLFYWIFIFIILLVHDTGLVLSSCSCIHCCFSREIFRSCNFAFIFTKAPLIYFNLCVICVCPEYMSVSSALSLFSNASLLLSFHIHLIDLSGSCIVSKLCCILRAINLQFQQDKE